MSTNTQIRVAQLTGSFGATAGDINDGGSNFHLENKASLATIGVKDLSGSLSFLATAIRRIHGGADFSNQDAGFFSETIQIADDKKIAFGSAGGGDATIEYDEDGTDELRFAGAAVTFEQAVSFDGAVTLGNQTGDDIAVTGLVTTDIVPKVDSTSDLGTSALQWAELHVDVGNIDQLGSALDANNQAMTNVDINSGAIDGTAIGAASATTIVGTTIDATTDFTIGDTKIEDGVITDTGALEIISTTMTLNASLDLALSADGGNVTMDDGTTTAFDFNVDDVELKIMDDSQVTNYLSLAVGDNGATTIQTVDADAAAANLQITADGTAELAGTLVTLDSGGDIVLSADGDNISFDDGTTTVFDFAVDNTPLMKIMDGTQTANFLSIGVAANGATTFTTVDADAAAANLIITADGTVDIDSAGDMTLDSGGGILLEPAAGANILLDGTIAVDAGVVTGATSITSTNFVGAIDGALGSVTPAAAVVTTLSATGNVDLGDNATDSVTVTGQFDSDLIPILDSTSDLGTAAKQWAEAHIDAGFIDAITVTGTSTLTTVDINGGNIDNTAIGAATPSTIVGTTITANTSVLPDAVGGATLGTAAAEWGDIFVADNKKISLGNDQDMVLEFNADGSQMGELSSIVAGGTMVTGGNLGLHLSGASGPLYMSSSHVICFAASGMVSGFDGQGIALADDADWNSFVTNFTNSSSLIGAINTLKTSDSVEPTLFSKAITSAQAANVATTVVKVAGNPGITNLINAKPSNVLVYLNGQLLALSGSGNGNVPAGKDYVIQLDGSTNVIKFGFPLEIDDQVSVYEMS